MAKTKINPVHYKPTWVFARFPNDADDMIRQFGTNALALTDVEMIALRVAISTFVKMSDGSDDDEIADKLALVCKSALKKLCAVLDFEFEEDASA